MSARPCVRCGHVPAAPTAPLTTQQRAMLGFLCRTIDARGTAPTCDEIAAEFGYRSLSTVVEHLRHLEVKGYIARVFNKRQAITVLFRGPGGEDVSRDPQRTNGVPLYDERGPDAQPARLRGVHS